MFSRWRDRLRNTLGLRVALWYAVIFIGSSLTLVALTYLLLAASLRQYDREIIETTLLEYAAAWRRGGVASLERAIRSNQSAAGYEPLLVRAVGPFGGVLFLNAPENWRTFDVSPLVAPEFSEQQRWTTVSAGGEALEVLTLRLADGTVFQVGKSTARRAQVLERFRTILFVDLFSIVTIGLAAGALFTASALQPVRALIATVDRILRTGRIESRVPSRRTGDAIDELSLLFNAMLDRIEALLAGMRGALDNVAHDLRTPMMRLRATAEAALQAEDPAVLRESLADCLEESERVVMMLDTLMDISEAETGTMLLRREPVSLGELARATIGMYEDVAEEKGVTLGADHLEDVVLELDPNRMRQVLFNLVDNAVKYTPAGGRVELAVFRAGGEAVVAVEDTGIGIADAELPRIWERLYRVDPSRAGRGLGLGLSLVKAIVEAHGGQTTVESTPGRGSRFEIRLPQRAPSPSITAV